MMPDSEIDALVAASGWPNSPMTRAVFRLGMLEAARIAEWVCPRTNKLLRALKAIRNEAGEP